MEILFTVSLKAVSGVVGQCKLEAVALLPRRSLPRIRRVFLHEEERHLNEGLD